MFFAFIFVYNSIHNCVCIAGGYARGKPELAW